MNNIVNTNSALVLKATWESENGLVVWLTEAGVKELKLSRESAYSIELQNRTYLVKNDEGEYEVVEYQAPKIAFLCDVYSDQEIDLTADFNGSDVEKAVHAQALTDKYTQHPELAINEIQERFELNEQINEDSVETEVKNIVLTEVNDYLFASFDVNQTYPNGIVVDEKNTGEWIDLEDGLLINDREGSNIAVHTNTLVDIEEIWSIVNQWLRENPISESVLNDAKEAKAKKEVAAAG